MSDPLYDNNDAPYYQGAPPTETLVKYLSHRLLDTAIQERLDVATHTKCQRHIDC